VARIKRDVSIETARADLAAVANQLEAELGDLIKGHRTNVVPLAGDLVRDSRSALLLLFGGVGCLLLIGCTNVAGLLVVAAPRGAANSASISRSARPRPRRPPAAARAMLLAVAGGALGVALAIWLMRLVPALLPPGVLPVTEIAPDASRPGICARRVGAHRPPLRSRACAPASSFRTSDMLKRGGRTMAGDAAPRLRARSSPGRSRSR
jgi:hypothetical protein